MDQLVTAIAAKKAQLDAMGAVPREALLGLQKAYDVDLTYTSNAIEGNTLTLRETAELIEHDITVGGKPLRDHLEAVAITTRCYGCANWRERQCPWRKRPCVNSNGASFSAANPKSAASTALSPAALPALRSSFPNSAKIPSLMKEFGEWLSKAAPGPATSFAAHYRLVAIHPFGDGNGRTARLLMNLLLLREGYPPVTVRPEDRKTYLETLEQASLRDDLGPFQTFLYRRLDTTLGEYLSVLQEALPPGTQTQ